VAKYEVGTIILQTDGSTSYTILERSADNDASLFESSVGGVSQWVTDKILDKFIADGKGYIKGEKPIKKEDSYIPSKNRLDSID
jgi:hypothetical protein